METVQTSSRDLGKKTNSVKKLNTKMWGSKMIHSQNSIWFEKDWCSNKILETNFFPDTFLIPSRPLPASFQTHSRYLPVNLGTPSIHPEDTLTQSRVEIHMANIHQEQHSIRNMQVVSLISVHYSLAIGD